MHLVDGVVSNPLVACASVVAVGAVALGLRRVQPDDVPKIALLSAAFFVASVIRVPIGPGAAHLMLTGLLGMILGPMIFPAVLAGLLMQSLVFGFGGVSVLGLNLLNVALPGYLAYVLFSPLLMRASAPVYMPASSSPPMQTRSPRIFALGAAAGGFAVLGSALMVAAALALSGDGFLPAAQLIVLAHLPVVLVEGLVVGVALSFLLKIKPGLFLAPGGFAKRAFS